MKAYPNGLTVAELKAYVATLPDINEETGEPNEVWMDSGTNLSSPVKSLWPLNDGDILFRLD